MLTASTRISPLSPVDDAYISLSYARNLVAGNGLVLTPAAEPVEAFSNLLWILVSAALDPVMPLPAAVVAANLVLVAVLPLVVYLLTRRLAPDLPRVAAIAAAVGVAVVPATAFHAATGMETIAFSLVLAAAATVFVRNGAAQPLALRAIPPLLALALLRPEGALIAGAWIAVSPGKRRKPFLLAAGLFVGAYAALTAWRLWYFDDLFPNSVDAKRGLSTVDAIAASRPYVSAFFTTYSPLLLLAAVGASAYHRALRVFAPPLVIISLVGLLGGHTDGYPYQRYLYPLVPLLLALACVGTGTIVTGLRARAGRLAAGLAAAGGVAVVATQLSLGEQPFRNRDLFDVRLAASGLRMLWRDDDRPHAASSPPYHELSRWLLTQTEPGQLVALQEIGITAYYSKLEVLDTFGLADETIADMPGVPGGKVHPEYVFGRAPDFFVIRLAPGCICPGLVADDAYARDDRLVFGYEFARLIPAANPTIAVFKRRGEFRATTSLAERLPLSSRLDQAPPQELDTILRTSPHQATPSTTAAARLHLQRWNRGIQWNGRDERTISTFKVEVPAAMRALVEALPSPPPTGNGGTWQMVAESGGERAVARRRVARGAPWRWEFMSLDVSRWGGRQVSVHLSFEAPCEDGACRPGWQVWTEPHLTMFSR